MDVLHERGVIDTLENVRDLVVGYYKKIPLLNGQLKQYINFDNAASTPILKPVLQTVNEAMEWYSSIHRGTGYKSQLCSEIYDYAREVVADFVKADLESQAIIFVKNATEGINKLAQRFPLTMDQMVLVSKMEHHSNDLPWRIRANVKHIDILEDGRLDENDMIRQLKKYHGKISLVALTGASNVTGWVNDINRLAEICHEYNVPILIDAAQLAPHRDIDMKPPGDPGHIDFLVLSAHKIYAPLGAGVLIGKKDFFLKGDPDYVGGGTVKIVDFDYAVWTDPPEKDEAGTPNTIGVMALAKSLLVIQELGMDRIAVHEMELTSYMLERLKKIRGIKIYGSADPEIVKNRLGVISFNLEGMPHALTAAILNYEGGVGVRNGCFCAHPYIKQLLGLSPEESKRIEKMIIEGDRSELPGAVRASFGMYNTHDEIDQFIETMSNVSLGHYLGDYFLDKMRGEYHPKGFNPEFDKYFHL